MSASISKMIMATSVPNLAVFKLILLCILRLIDQITKANKHKLASSLYTNKLTLPVNVVIKLILINGTRHQKINFK
jgi:uncharacterized membrane protein